MVLNYRKLTPAILTLLVFLLAQGLGTVLLLGIGILLSPESCTAIHAYLDGRAQGLPMLDLMPISLLSLILMMPNILAVLCCCFILRNIRFTTAFDITTIRWRPAMLAVLGAVLGAFGISILTDNLKLPDAMEQVSLAMSHDFWGMVTLVIIGPIAEELLFREAIAGEMLRRGTAPWTAIVVSALAFSAMHFNLAQGCYAFPLGIMLGIIYYKTGNIVLTSLLHMLNNGIVVVQLYTAGEDAIDASLTEWFGSDCLAHTIMALSIVFSIALMIAFWKLYIPCNKGEEIRRN